MKSIKIGTQNEYNVVIGNGTANKKAFESFADARLFLLTDETLSSIYSVNTPYSYIIPSGEKSKTFENAGKILQKMCDCGLTRNDVLVAFGGGVVGDIGGFCASVYMRGIRYVQVPTTLLASVDSSVGGKTAVDFCGHKNLVGAFYQPAKVLCDTHFLSTLPERQFNAGMAEVIKYGVISDSDFFEKLENRQLSTEEIIIRCVEIKKDTVVQDVFDRGLRRILNFGHTVGHAVEKLSGYGYLHGEAVAIGMCIMMRGCEKLGLSEKESALRTEEILKSYSLPTVCKFSYAEILKETLFDKKRTGENTDIAVVPKIGISNIVSADAKMLEEIIRSGL